MRLDKYLQVTGLIKRRALANEACKLGLVKINGVTAKATREISVNDVIDISLARREMSIKVLQLIAGNSLKKTIRDEYFAVIKDIEKTVVNDFWQGNPDE